MLKLLFQYKLSAQALFYPTYSVKNKLTLINTKVWIEEQLDKQFIVNLL